MALHIEKLTQVQKLYDLLFNPSSVTGVSKILIILHCLYWTAGLISIDHQPTNQGTWNTQRVFRNNRPTAAEAVSAPPARLVDHHHHHHHRAVRAPRDHRPVTAAVVYRQQDPLASIGH